MDRGSWHCTGGKDQDHPQEKEMKKGKQLSDKAYKSLRKEEKLKAKEKMKDTPIWMQNSKEEQVEIKKAFHSDQCKEIEENNRMRKTRDLFRKIRDTKGKFHAQMRTIKDRKGIDIIEVEDIKKRWKEYTEELYKKNIHDPYNHDCVITHLEPDILECEAKWL